MHAEAVSGFVIIGAGGIVVEHPAGVLGAAGFVDEPPDLLVVPVPEPADATMLAVFCPRCASMCLWGSSGATNS